MDFAQQLVNGVQIGSVYALVAIGYTMVYGIAKMINFAHGDIIMVGSYVALLFFQSSGLPVWGVIAATAAVSAVLGVTILNIDNGYNFMESIVCAAGAGIGFLVAMVLFSGVRRRVEEAVTPKCFEGLPITLVSAAVTSLSFMGFGGIIESIFHV